MMSAASFVILCCTGGAQFRCGSCSGVSTEVVGAVSGVWYSGLRACYLHRPHGSYCVVRGQRTRRM